MVVDRKRTRPENQIDAVQQRPEKQTRPHGRYGGPNQRPPSGYFGVYANKKPDGKLWKAQIFCEGTQYNLGTFDTKEEASRVYDVECWNYPGIDLPLNYPRSSSDRKPSGPPLITRQRNSSPVPNGITAHSITNADALEKQVLNLEKLTKAAVAHAGAQGVAHATAQEVTRHAPTEPPLIINTTELNQQQRKPRPASGYYGVYAEGVRWNAQIYHSKGRHRLGVFWTRQEAALVYDRAARVYNTTLAALCRQKPLNYESVEEAEEAATEAQVKHTLTHDLCAALPRPTSKAPSPTSKGPSLLPRSPLTGLTDFSPPMRRNPVRLIRSTLSENPMENPPLSPGPSATKLKDFMNSAEGSETPPALIPPPPSDTIDWRAKTIASSAPVPPPSLYLPYAGTAFCAMPEGASVSPPQVGWSTILRIKLLETRRKELQLMTGLAAPMSAPPTVANAAPPVPSPPPRTVPQTPPRWIREDRPVERIGKLDRSVGASARVHKQPRPAERAQAAYAQYMTQYLEDQRAATVSQASQRIAAARRQSSKKVTNCVTDCKVRYI
jgi:hypothetical protein